MLILTNNDYEEAPTGENDTGRDYDDAVAMLDGTDDDLMKITLDPVSTNATEGSINLKVSNESAVRLFKPDGTVLSERAVEHASGAMAATGLIFSCRRHLWTRKGHTARQSACYWQRVIATLIHLRPCRPHE